MVTFYKSDEGIREYQKINKPYPATVWDQAYDQFLTNTASSPKNRNQTELLRITRLKVKENEEYILYTIREIRFDGLGNRVKPFTRDDLGQYPQPQANRTLYYDANHQPQYRYEDPYDIYTAYSIPFSSTKADELHKLARDDVPERAGRTQYFVQLNTQAPRTIYSYTDWRDGDFDDLYKNGKITPDFTKTKQQEKEKAKQVEEAREISEDPKVPEQERLKASRHVERVTSGELEAETTGSAAEAGVEGGSIEDELNTSSTVEEEQYQRQKLDEETAEAEKSRNKRRSR